jgi:hypothetical protein
VTKRQNIQPVETELVGTDLTTALNDRIRRINQALAETTPAAAAATGGGNFIYEVPAGVLNSSNRVFTLSKTPKPALSLALEVNGLLQAQSGSGAPWTDYTLSGRTITFRVAPDSGDWIFAGYSF